MRSALAPAQDMDQLYSLHQEIVCEKKAMASLGYGFGTHETGVTRPGQAHQFLHCQGEPGGLHPVRVVAEAGTGEGFVRRMGAEPLSSQTTQIGKPGVRGPCSTQELPERFQIEVGIPSRPGVGADVGYVPDAKGEEDLNKCCGSPVAVPDGEKHCLVGRRSFHNFTVTQVSNLGNDPNRAPLTSPVWSLKSSGNQSGTGQRGVEDPRFPLNSSTAA